MSTSTAVACQYCAQPAELIRWGNTGYPYPADWGSAWKCTPCDACIRCYAGGTEPLGTLANAETREWRSRAHAAFDPLWMDGGMSRSAAYAWAAQALSCTESEAHIGRMDPGMCQRLIAAVTRHNDVGQ